jgi:hypothetical protein
VSRRNLIPCVALAAFAKHRLAAVGLASVALVGCSAGPLFRVDPALRQTGGLRVGGGATETATCPDESASKDGGNGRGDADPPRETHPFEVGRRITFGNVAASVEELRTGTSVSHLMADASLRAMVSVRESAGQTAEAAKLRLAIAEVAGETSTSGGAKVAHAAAKASGAITTTLQTIDDLHTLATLPKESAEQMSFAIRVQLGARAVAMSCQSVDVVHFFKLYAGPDFALDCAVVPVDEEPLPPWAIQVRATGTSRSYRFSGGLARATPRTDLLFGDQHYGMLGATLVTGFEIRTGGAQSAAVSFYPFVNGKVVDEPRVWLLPPPPGDQAEQDVRAAMMALAILYPWPTPCSAQQKSAL